MREIIWLHFSDLHIRLKKLNDLKIILNALWKDLKTLAEKGYSPDFITFTGDIAWGGKKKDYELAKEYFFDPLLKKTGINDKKRLVWVPGNHDVDRGIVKRNILAEEGASAKLVDRDTVNEFLDDENQRKRLFGRLTAYAKFTSNYFGDLLAVHDPRYYITRILDIDGVKVGLACLNSAWRSIGEGDEKDQGRLLIGERQLDAAAAEITNTDLKIALVHHPFDFLHPCDRETIETRAYKEFNIVLQGHLHTRKIPDIEISKTPAGELLRLPAGAIFESRGFEGYSVMKYNPATRKAKVVFRRYIDKTREFIPDAESVPPNGEFEASFTYPTEPVISKEEVDKIKHPASTLELIFMFDWIVDGVASVENVALTFGESRRLLKSMRDIHKSITARLPRLAEQMPSECFNLISRFLGNPLRNFLHEADIVLPHPWESRYTRDRKYLKEFKYAVLNQWDYSVKPYLLSRLDLEKDFEELKVDTGRWSVLGFTDEESCREFISPTTKSLFKYLTERQRELLTIIAKTKVASEPDLLAEGFPKEEIVETINCLLRDRWLEVIKFEPLFCRLTPVAARLLTSKLGFADLQSDR